MTESLHANQSSIKALNPEEQRLGQLAGSTLHKLLNCRSRNAGFRYGEKCPLHADVIAVDEVSMVDVVMMDHLIQAIDAGRTKLIYCPVKSSIRRPLGRTNG